MQFIPDPSSCDPGQLSNSVNEAMVREHGWSESLELYYSQLDKAISLEQIVRELSGARGLNALAYIYSKAMLLGSEVFRLASGGFPDGAMARCRSLHELVLCGFFISKMSALGFDPLIGPKYIDHEWVRRKALLEEQASLFKSIKKTAEYSEELRVSHEATKKDLKVVIKKIDELKKRYGKDFTKIEYGWAYSAVKQYNKHIGKSIAKCGSAKIACCEKNCCENPCCKILRVNLGDLKNAVGNKDLESVFKLGNQAAHAGALSALPLLPISLMHHVLINGSVQMGHSIPIRMASYGLERILYLTSVNLKDARVDEAWREHSENYKKLVAITGIAEKKAEADFRSRIPMNLRNKL